MALPGVVAHGITQLLSGYFVSVGRYGTPSLVAWFNLIVASLLQVTLIPRLGITGASLGLSITYVLGACIIARLYMNAAGQPAGSLIPGTADFGVYRQMSRNLIQRLRPLTS
jgi:O-antigen/teichoic acid export membrane protein